MSYVGMHSPLKAKLMQRKQLQQAMTLEAQSLPVGADEHTGRPQTVTLFLKGHLLRIGCRDALALKAKTEAKAAAKAAGDTGGTKPANGKK